MEVDDFLCSLFSVFTNSSISIQNEISVSCLLTLLAKAVDVIQDEPVLLKLLPPIYIVGDIHGNIDALLRIFEKGGFPPKSKYCFLGDYVDRGSYSLEVILLLLSLKIKFPNHIFLLRGNHESPEVSMIYGFYSEIVNKYSSYVFDYIQTVFSKLPLCAVVGEEIFCVHGGIGEDTPLLSEIEDYPKPINVKGKNIFSNFVWSDPRYQHEEFILSKRGTGYYFNERALHKLLSRNNLKLLIRSHEKCSDGSKYVFRNCLTIFSSTDYCGENNNAAIALVRDSCEVEIYPLLKLTPQQVNKRRVMIPEWLVPLMAKAILFSCLFEEGE